MYFKELFNKRLEMEDIEVHNIRFSQSSIYPYIMDEKNMYSVEYWKDQLPYTLPLEVIRIHYELYVCLDNERLYAAKKHYKYETNKTVKCIVYELNDPVPFIMHESGLDIMTILWISGNILHRMFVRANNMSGVMIARCAAQNSTFSKNGEYDLPLVDSMRLFENLKKINSGRFNISNDIFENFLLEKETIYIQPVQGFNIYHERSDLVEVIITRPDIFYCEKYEQCTNYSDWFPIGETNGINTYEVFQASEAFHRRERIYSLRRLSIKK